mgnify:CR=1 FL=1
MHFLLFSTVFIAAVPALPGESSGTQRYVLTLDRARELAREAAERLGEERGLAVEVDERIPDPSPPRPEHEPRVAGARGAAGRRPK